MHRSVYVFGSGSTFVSRMSTPRRHFGTVEINAANVIIHNSYPLSVYQITTMSRRWSNTFHNTLRVIWENNRTMVLWCAIFPSSHMLVVCDLLGLRSSRNQSIHNQTYNVYVLYCIYMYQCDCTAMACEGKQTNQPHTHTHNACTSFVYIPHTVFTSAFSGVPHKRTYLPPTLNAAQ